MQDLKTYDKYECNSIVSKALDEIEEDLRTITVLYYYNGFSVKEISEMLNIPEGTVESIEKFV